MKLGVLVVDTKVKLWIEMYRKKWTKMEKLLELYEGTYGISGQPKPQPFTD